MSSQSKARPFVYCRHIPKAEVKLWGGQDILTFGMIALDLSGPGSSGDKLVA